MCTQSISSTKCPIQIFSTALPPRLALRQTSITKNESHYFLQRFPYYFPAAAGPVQLLIGGDIPEDFKENVAGSVARTELPTASWGTGAGDERQEGNWEQIQPIVEDKGGER